MPIPAPVSRRAALGGLASLAGVLGSVLSGCTASPLSSARPPAGTLTPTASASPAGREPSSPDVRLAAAVLRSEQALLDRVRATARRHPGLAPQLDAAQRSHRAHVDLLTGAVPPAARPSRPAADRHRVPGGSRAAMSALARAEEQLARRRRGHALQARSGPFARVLASMAAAASQQATFLAPAARDRR